VLTIFDACADLRSRTKDDYMVETHEDKMPIRIDVGVRGESFRTSQRGTNCTTQCSEWNNRRPRVTGTGNTFVRGSPSARKSTVCGVSRNRPGSNAVKTFGMADEEKKAEEEEEGECAPRDATVPDWLF
jgi:hypothetical protein